MSKTKTLVLKKLSKKYGDFIANDNISLEFNSGEIHAILGENGAGKTTLMKTIYGVHMPSSGNILIDSREVNFKSPYDAIVNGIGMVFQHFMLIEKFTALQNIILGFEKTKFFLIDYKRALREVESLMRKYSLNVDLNLKIEDASVGLSQKVEILKVLYRKAKILIFDEPTAVLSLPEIEEFMNILKILAREGHTIILITHKIKEIKRVAKKCSIMRAGRLVKTVDVDAVNEDELARLMIGRDFKPNTYEKTKVRERQVLRLEKVNVRNKRGILKVKDLSFTLHEREILGIAGLEGSGQEELLEAILGIRKVESGEIFKDFEKINNLSVKEIIDRKFAYIPANRHKEAVILEYDLTGNLALKNFDNREFLNSSKTLFLFKQFSYKKLKERAKKLSAIFDVRPQNPSLAIKDFSGGNQQKFVVAREIDLNPDVILAMQPTRGLDFGAVTNIYRELVKKREEGTAILLVSLELEELINVCDRIAVIYNGSLVKILKPNYDLHEIGILMSGVESAK